MYWSVWVNLLFDALVRVGGFVVYALVRVGLLYHWKYAVDVLMKLFEFFISCGM